MEKLLGHYRPQTIKIADHFKIFKWSQKRGDSEFMAKLRWLARRAINTVFRNYGG